MDFNQARVRFTQLAAAAESVNRYLEKSFRLSLLSMQISELKGLMGSLNAQVKAYDQVIRFWEMTNYKYKGEIDELKKIRNLDAKKLIIARKVISQLRKKEKRNPSKGLTIQISEDKQIKIDGGGNGDIETAMKKVTRGIPAKITIKEGDVIEVEELPQANAEEIAKTEKIIKLDRRFEGIYPEVGAAISDKAKVLFSGMSRHEYLRHLVIIGPGPTAGEIGLALSNLPSLNKISVIEAWYPNLEKVLHDTMRFKQSLKRRNIEVDFYYMSVTELDKALKEDSVDVAFAYLSIGTEMLSKKTFTAIDAINEALRKDGFAVVVVPYVAEIGLLGVRFMPRDGAERCYEVSVQVYKKKIPEVLMVSLEYDKKDKAGRLLVSWSKSDNLADNSFLDRIFIDGGQVVGIRELSKKRQEGKFREVFASEIAREEFALTYPDRVVNFGYTGSLQAVEAEKAMVTRSVEGLRPIFLLLMNQAIITDFSVNKAVTSLVPFAPCSFTVIKWTAREKGVFAILHSLPVLSDMTLDFVLAELYGEVDKIMLSFSRQMINERPGTISQIGELLLSKYRIPSERILVFSPGEYDFSRDMRGVRHIFVDSEGVVVFDEESVRGPEIKLWSEQGTTGEFIWPWEKTGDGGDKKQVDAEKPLIPLAHRKIYGLLNEFETIFRMDPKKTTAFSAEGVRMLRAIFESNDNRIGKNRVRELNFGQQSFLGTTGCYDCPAVTAIALNNNSVEQVSLLHMRWGGVLSEFYQNRDHFGYIEAKAEEILSLLRILSPTKEKILLVVYREQEKAYVNQIAINIRKECVGLKARTIFIGRAEDMMEMSLGVSVDGVIIRTRSMQGRVFTAMCPWVYLSNLFGHDNEQLFYRMDYTGDHPDGGKGVAVDKSRKPRIKAYDNRTGGLTGTYIRISDIVCAIEDIHRNIKPDGGNRVSTGTIFLPDGSSGHYFTIDGRPSRIEFLQKESVPGSFNIETNEAVAVPVDISRRLRISLATDAIETCTGISLQLTCKGVEYLICAHVFANYCETWEGYSEEAIKELMLCLEGLVNPLSGRALVYYLPGLQVFSRQRFEELFPDITLMCLTRSDNIVQKADMKVYPDGTHFSFLMGKKRYARIIPWSSVRRVDVDAIDDVIGKISFCDGGEKASSTFVRANQLQIFNSWLEWLSGFPEAQINRDEFWTLAYNYLGKNSAQIAEALNIGADKVKAYQEVLFIDGLLERGEEDRSYRVTAAAEAILDSLEFILKMPDVSLKGKSRNEGPGNPFCFWDIVTKTAKILKTTRRLKAVPGNDALMITRLRIADLRSIQFNGERLFSERRFKDREIAIRGNNSFLVVMAVKDLAGNLTVGENALPVFFVKEGRASKISGLASALRSMRKRGEIISIANLAEELRVDLLVLASYFSGRPEVKQWFDKNALLKKEFGMEEKLVPYQAWMDWVRGHKGEDFSTGEFWTLVYMHFNITDAKIIELLHCHSQMFEAYRRRLELDGLLEMREGRYVLASAAETVLKSLEFIQGTDDNRFKDTLTVGGHKEKKFFNVWDADSGSLEVRVNNLSSRMFRENRRRVITEYSPSPEGVIRLGDQAVMTLEDYKNCEMAIALDPNLTVIMLVKDVEGNPVTLNSGLPLFFIKRNKQREVAGVASAIERIKARGEKVSLPGLSKELQLQRPGFYAFLQNNPAWSRRVIDIVLPAEEINQAIDEVRGNQDRIGGYLRKQGYVFDKYLLQRRIKALKNDGRLFAGTKVLFSFFCSEMNKAGQENRSNYPRLVQPRLKKKVKLPEAISVEGTEHALLISVDGESFEPATQKEAAIGSRDHQPGIAQLRLDKKEGLPEVLSDRKVGPALTVDVEKGRIELSDRQEFTKEKIKFIVDDKRLFMRTKELFSFFCFEMNKAEMESGRNQRLSDLYAEGMLAYTRGEYLRAVSLFESLVGLKNIPKYYSISGDLYLRLSRERLYSDLFLEWAMLTKNERTVLIAIVHELQPSFTPTQAAQSNLLSKLFTRREVYMILRGLSREEKLFYKGTRLVKMEGTSYKVNCELKSFIKEKIPLSEALQISKSELLAQLIVYVDIFRQLIFTKENKKNEKWQDLITDPVIKLAFLRFKGKEDQDFLNWRNFVVAAIRARAASEKSRKGVNPEAVRARGRKIVPKNDHADGGISKITKSSFSLSGGARDNLGPIGVLTIDHHSSRTRAAEKLVLKMLEDYSFGKERDLWQFRSWQYDDETFEQIHAFISLWGKHKAICLFLTGGMSDESIRYCLYHAFRAALICASANHSIHIILPLEAINGTIGNIRGSVYCDLIKALPAKSRIYINNDLYYETEAYPKDDISVVVTFYTSIALCFQYFSGHNLEILDMFRRSGHRDGGGKNNETEIIALLGINTERSRKVSLLDSIDIVLRNLERGYLKEASGELFGRMAIGDIQLIRAPPEWRNGLLLLSKHRKEYVVLPEGTIRADKFTSLLRSATNAFKETENNNERNDIRPDPGISAWRPQIVRNGSIPQTDYQIGKYLREISFSFHEYLLGQTKTKDYAPGKVYPFICKLASQALDSMIKEEFLIPLQSGSINKIELIRGRYQFSLPVQAESIHYWLKMSWGGEDYFIDPTIIPQLVCIIAYKNSLMAADEGLQGLFTSYKALLPYLPKVILFGQYRSVSAILQQEIGLMPVPLDKVLYPYLLNRCRFDHSYGVEDNDGGFVNKPSISGKRISIPALEDISSMVSRGFVHRDNKVPYIVGIGGGAGAGKTTFAEKLKLALEALQLNILPLGIDEFIRLGGERKRIGTEWDDRHVRLEEARDFLAQVEQGAMTVNRRIYDRSQPLELREVSVKLENIDIIIFEGLYALNSEPRLGGLVKYVDLAVYMHAPYDAMRQWRFEQELKKPKPRTKAEMEKHWQEGIIPDLYNNIYPSIKNADLVIYVDYYRGMNVYSVEQGRILNAKGQGRLESGFDGGSGIAPSTAREALAMYISEKFPEAAKIIEIGVGRDLTAAAAIMGYLPLAEIVVSDNDEDKLNDIRVRVLEKKLRLTVIPYDLFGDTLPKEFSGAGIIYSVRPFRELIPPLAKLASGLKRPLLIYLLDDDKPSVQEMRRYGLTSANYYGYSFIVSNPVIKDGGINWSAPLLVWHRGGGKDKGYPENTLFTLRQAIKDGAKCVELDVRLLSGRGVAYVSHDALSVEQVLSWKAVNTRSESQPGPLLVDFLRVVKDSGSGMELQIELKGEDALLVPEVLAILEQFGMISRVMITSFNRALLEEARRSRKDIRIGFLAAFDERRNKPVISEVKELKFDAVLFHAKKLDPEMVEYARDLGLQIGAWGAKDSLEFNLLMNTSNIDRFTSDIPRVLASKKQAIAYLVSRERRKLALFIIFAGLIGVLLEPFLLVFEIIFLPSIVLLFWSASFRMDKQECRSLITRSAWVAFLFGTLVIFCGFLLPPLTIGMIQLVSSVFLWVMCLPHILHSYKPPLFLSRIPFWIFPLSFPIIINVPFLAMMPLLTQEYGLALVYASFLAQLIFNVVFLIGQNNIRLYARLASYPGNEGLRFIRQYQLRSLINPLGTVSLKIMPQILLINMVEQSLRMLGVLDPGAFSMMGLSYIIVILLSLFLSAKIFLIPGYILRKRGKTTIILSGIVVLKDRVIGVAAACMGRLGMLIARPDKYTLRIFSNDFRKKISLFVRKNIVAQLFFLLQGVTIVIIAGSIGLVACESALGLYTVGEVLLFPALLNNPGVSGTYFEALNSLLIFSGAVAGMVKWYLNEFYGEALSRGPPNTIIAGAACVITGRLLLGILGGCLVLVGFTMIALTPLAWRIGKKGKQPPGGSNGVEDESGKLLESGDIDGGKKPGNETEEQVILRIFARLLGGYKLLPESAIHGTLIPDFIVAIKDVSVAWTEDNRTIGLLKLIFDEYKKGRVPEHYFASNIAHEWATLLLGHHDFYEQADEDAMDAEARRGFERILRAQELDADALAARIMAATGYSAEDYIVSLATDDRLLDKAEKLGMLDDEEDGDLNDHPSDRKRIRAIRELELITGFPVISYPLGKKISILFERGKGRKKELIAVFEENCIVWYEPYFEIESAAYPEMFRCRAGRRLIFRQQYMGGTGDGGKRCYAGCRRNFVPLFGYWNAYFQG